MNRAVVSTAITIMAACLTACGDGKREEAPSIDRAEGEILEHSISDDMLPYDSLRSQPPLADPEEAKKSAARESRPGSDGDDSPGEAQVPAPEPAISGSEARPDAE